MSQLEHESFADKRSYVIAHIKEALPGEQKSQKTWVGFLNRGLVRTAILLCAMLLPILFIGLSWGWGVSVAEVNKWHATTAIYVIIGAVMLNAAAAYYFVRGFASRR